MSRAGKKNPPDRGSRPQDLSRPGHTARLRDEGPIPRSDGSDSHPMKIGRGSFPPSRYAATGVCGLLLLAVALVFGQTVRHEFLTDYDDKDYVDDNPQVARGFTTQGIAWAFTHFHSANWHPLTWLSHMLDCQLYHLRAGGHHATSAVIHGVSAVLLYLLLLRTTSRRWPSAVAAAVFAVHPLR